MEIISKRIFENETVEVDGHAFHDCAFKNCTLVYGARANVQFERCSFDSIVHKFTAHARATIGYLKSLNIKLEDVEHFGERFK